MKKVDCYKLFSLYIIMSETTYYERNRYVILNRANKYYENYDKVLRELSEEEKNIKREYGRNGYHNMSEGKKQRSKEYQKNYGEANKDKKT